MLDKAVIKLFATMIKKTSTATVLLLQVLKLLGFVACRWKRERKREIKGGESVTETKKKEAR